MKIECILKRDNGTKAELGGIEYHFAPLADGAHVADVTDKDHIDRFLAIPDGYRLYHGDLEAKGGATKVAEPKVPTKPAPPPAASTAPLAGSELLPPTFEVNGSTYTQLDIAKLAQAKADLTADEWNELGDDDRAARMEIVLDDLADAEDTKQPATPDQERAELVAKYEAKFGRKPNSKITIETLRAKLAE